MNTGYLWRVRKTGIDERCREASLAIGSRSHKDHAYGSSPSSRKLVKAERRVLGTSKWWDPDGSNGLFGHHLLLLIRFSQNSVSGGTGRLEDQQLRVRRAAAQEGLAERPCLLFPASCLGTKLYTGAIPNPCAYSSPLEPKRPGLALCLLRNPRWQTQRGAPKALDVEMPGLLSTRNGIYLGSGICCLLRLRSAL